MADRVVLKRFEFPHEAELCASILRNEGIAATVDDALLVGPNPLMNIGYGGVKVRISADDMERAEELLGEIDEANRQNDSEPPAPQISDGERRIGRAHAAALVGIVLGPGIVHLYALYLVLSVRNAELSDKGRNLRNFTLVISTIMVAVAAWVVMTIAAR